MKILIAGYYGFGNLGDELILSTIIGQIGNQYKSASLCVLSASPEETNQTHDVPSVSRWSLVGVIKEIWRADIFILGGGGLLQNKTSNRSLIYYLGLIGLARLFQCHIILYAMGVESISGKIWGPLLYRLLSSRKVRITVRDGKSKDLLLKTGLAAESIFVTADPVFSRSVSNPSKERYPVFPLVRALLIPRFSAPESGSNIFDAVSALLIENHNVAVKATLFQPEIEKKIAKSGNLKNIPLIDAQLLVKEASVLTDFDFVVSGRFHGLVLAALASRPFIGVGDPDKIQRLCQVFEMPYLSWDANKSEINAAIGIMISLNRPQINQTALQKARLAAQQNIEHLLGNNFININAKL